MPRASSWNGPGSFARRASVGALRRFATVTSVLLLSRITSPTTPTTAPTSIIDPPTPRNVERSLSVKFRVLPFESVVVEFDDEPIKNTMPPT